MQAVPDFGHLIFRQIYFAALSTVDFTSRFSAMRLHRRDVGGMRLDEVATEAI